METLGGDILHIDLIPLKNGIQKNIPIEEALSFSEEMLENTELLALKDVWVSGFLFKNAIEEIECDLTISGVMVLPCSITLEETDYPFTSKINDTLVNLLEEMGEKTKKVENSIDIFPIIWENILMEIPMKVVSENASFEKKEGDGWKLITEEEEKEVINPAFEKLKDLL